MSDEEELAKDLGLLSAMTIGIGTMIGAGIFVLPGVAAQEAGPIVVVSFVIGGIIAMINAFAVSELGTAMPKAGGGYFYVNRGLGPLFGSISGMGDWIGLAFASAFYCIGFGGYLVVLIGDASVALPAVGTVPILPAFDLVVFELTQIQVGAVIAGALFAGVNYIGAKETGGIQSVIVLTLLAILTVFAASGIFHFDWGTVTGEGGLTPMGGGAILPATAIVFVSFLGYAKIATVAEEMKNPGRNLPIAVIGSVAIVTVIYAILVGLMVGIVPWSELSDTTPVSQVSEITFAGVPVLGAVGVGAISLAALLATASSANASILASARINFAMGRDRIVTDWLNEIHPSYATPYRSILVTGGMIVVFVIALGQDIEVLAKAASVLHLIVYGLMNLALIAFRETDVEDYDPDFTVPLYPITPILGAAFSFGLIYFMAWYEQALAGLFVLGAIVWYFVYARGETTAEGALTQHVLHRAEEMPDAAVEAAEATAPDGAGPFRIVVPLANPRTEEDLIELATRIAGQHEAAVVQAVHVVQVPDQTPLQEGAANVDRIDEESARLLENAREHARHVDPDVDVETSTVISHRAAEEVFDVARRKRADLLVMGWGADRPWSAGRAESTFGELTGELPCDVLMLRDRGIDLDRILLPTAGGPDSDLSAEVARALRTTSGSAITLLHALAEDEIEADGEAFLEAWAGEHGLADAERMVSTTDPEDAIVDAAADHTLLLMGATERGLLTRLVSESLHDDVAERVDCSVLLAERPSDRSLRARLFGSD